MRLPKGLLKKLEDETGIANTKFCDYAATRIRPGRKRALVLETACRNLGIDVPAIVWLYGSSDEIKSRILQKYNGNGDKSEGVPEHSAGAKPQG